MHPLKPIVVFVFFVANLSVIFVISVAKFSVIFVANKLRVSPFVIFVVFVAKLVRVLRGTTNWTAAGKRRVSRRAGRALFTLGGSGVARIHGIGR